MKIFLITTVAMMMGINIQAGEECKAFGLDFYSYSASIQNGNSFEFLKSGKILTGEQKNSLMINECTQAAKLGKKILIGLGPKEYSFSILKSSTQNIVPILNDGCSIENSPFPNVQTFEERTINNIKKLKFIESCVDIYITDESTQPLKYEVPQKNCKITKINENSIIANGGECLLGINADSNIKIQYDIKEECRNLDGLIKYGLSPMEVITDAQIYQISNDTETNSILKKYITHKTIRFNIEPSPTQGKLTEDFDNSGLPLYFSDFFVPDLHFGEIRIKSAGSRSRLDIDLLADNRCKKLCDGEACTSPCDYSVPLVGIFTLNKISKSGKKLFLKEWYGGSVIPANFQGILPMMSEEIPDFSYSEDGEQYLLEFKLTDPRFEYQMFKKTFKGIDFAPIPGFPSGGFYSNLNSGLSSLSNTSSISAIPTFGNIGEFTGANGIGGLGNGINSMTEYSHWPADFESLCDQNGKNCRNLSNTPYLTFLVKFKVEKNPTGNQLKDLRIERKSTILPNYTKTGTDVPKIKCI